MTHAHGCVWIDHREAKIFGIGFDDADEVVIHNHQAPRHIHRRADNVHLGTAPLDHGFLDEVAGALGPFKSIVLTGPGKARTELAGYLSQHYPVVARKVIGIEPVDHPSDGQIVAAARKYFKAADRMRS
jgi:stalled ribosome rescue protein Dom34